MRTLITGATGLIGKNLIGHLRGEIHVIARSKRELVELRKKHPGIKVIVGDIQDEKLVKRSLRYVDVVYHLAALRAVGAAEKNVADCIHTNIIGTENLLKHFAGKQFITLSTDKAVKVTSTYGATKFLVERLVKEYAKKTLKSSYYIFRCGNVFHSTDSVISVWKKQLIDKQDINVTDLSATRYFCTVEQVIDTIFKGMREFPFGATYVPTLKSVSVGTLLKAMQLKYGEATKINIIGRQVGENKHERLVVDGVSSDKADKYTLEEIIGLV